MRYLSLSILSAIALAGCTSSHDGLTQDLSALEVPPYIVVITQTATAAVTEPELEDTSSKKPAKSALDGIVSLDLTPPSPSIKIKKLFDRSWAIVAKALKISAISITDKNRDKGIFYISFAQEESLSSWLSGTSETLPYKVTVTWGQTHTTVVSQPIKPKKSPLDDPDDDFDFANAQNQAKAIIEQLYQVMKHEWPSP